MDYILSVVRDTASLFLEMSPFLLLGFLLAGILHAFVPSQLYARYLSADNLRSVVMAALLGIPLPLCSCGVIPTAMSLRREGASRSATVSFLIATPQTGVDSIMATYSLMGLPFAVVRPLAALLTALWGGFLTTRVSDGCSEAASAPAACVAADAPLRPTLGQRMADAMRFAFVEMMEDIGKWLVVGLLVAGLITALVPESLFAVFRDNTLMSILFVLVFSMPMYLCATGSIPIAVALMMKGITPGAALVLLMAGPACNVASILVIGKVMGRRTLWAYLAAIVTGAVAFALGMDWLLPREWFAERLQGGGCCGEGGGEWWHLAAGALLLLLLFNALVVNRFRGKSHAHHHHAHAHGRTVLQVKGMNCNHCASNARKALESVAGVDRAEVDLASGTAVVEGCVPDLQSLMAALEALGFSAEPKEQTAR